MKPPVKNLLAVIAGIIVGGLLNMGLIMLSSSIIPLPEGVDPTNMESLKAAMPSFEPKHFLFPWLAHAFGTLLGAFVASRLAANRQKMMALIVGVFFLIGGVANVLSLPAPGWFSALDIGLAYLPMAWLGWRLGRKSDD